MTTAFYNHIIFDLDGTLSDSRKGIYNATFFMCEKMGIQTPTTGQLTDLIGPPLQEGLRKVFGLDDKYIDIAVKTFREYYSEKGLFENELFPGVVSLLSTLAKEGRQLYIATSKFEIYAWKVLQFFKIQGYFADIAGADYNGLKAGKDSLILTLLQRNGISDPDNIVLIGDSKYDIEAAGSLGIDSIGVAYGFSSFEEMTGYNPDYIVSNIDELHHLLIKKE